MGHIPNSDHQMRGSDRYLCTEVEKSFNSAVARQRDKAHAMQGGLSWTCIEETPRSGGRHYSGFAQPNVLVPTPRGSWLFTVRQRALFLLTRADSAPS
jgi:hypothetical protein